MKAPSPSLFALMTSSLLLASACSQAAPAPAPGPDQTIVPAETADAESLAILSSWTTVPSFAGGRYLGVASQDRETGEPAPVGILDNHNRDMNNFVCASANAEIEMPVLVPLVLDLERCPEDFVRGFVMARIEGSGRLARLWLTASSLRAGAADREMLRIYVDDERTPLIQVPLAAALDGSAGEIFAPPFGAGSGQYLAWYYPVVFSKKLIVAFDRIRPSDLIFHQTDVVLDDPPVARARSANRLDLRDTLAKLLSALSQGPGIELPILPAASFTLQPGQSTTVADLAGPMTLHAVRLRLAADLVPALKDVHVTVRWDDSAPAIDQSLGTLFAAALDAPTTQSLPLAGNTQGSDVTLALRLPMPFAMRSEWSLSNQGTAPVTLEISMDGTNGTPNLPPAPFGHLHTEAHDTVGPSMQTHHPIADIQGRGRYVGTCLMLQGHQLPPGNLGFGPFNFLEGDETALIDGQLAFPGTGTEDYLNSAFYFESGQFGTAFAQAHGIVTEPPVDPTNGRVTACRWHVLGDAIDFGTSFNLSLEVGPGDPSLLDRYQSTAFYYR